MVRDNARGPAPADRVLVVEDEGIVAMELEALLEQAGYSICGVVTTGEQALALAQEVRPDLVIMDIRLRGKLDGIDTAQTLQETLKPAIVFLTAYSDSTTLARAKVIEPFGYVLKPFNRRALLATVQLALFRHRAEKERQEARELAERAETRLAVVLDHSHDGIVTVDTEQNIIIFNRGAQRIFGYGADEVLGKPVTELLPESATPAHHAHLARFFDAPRTGRDLSGVREVLGRRKNGDIFPAEISISLVPLSQGVAATACIRDVSERNRYEKQVSHAERMHAVGRLAASVVHEFNNLLTALQANAQLLKSHVAGTGDDYIEEVFGIVHRGMALTRHLLAFTRSQDEKRVTRIVEINRVVERVEPLLQRLLPGKIKLHLDLHADAGYVYVDEYFFEQVVMNLVLNARDAMPLGGIVGVKTYNVNTARAALGQSNADLPRGAYALIEVTDSGAGIPPDIRDKVFEPFFTTKPAGLGTGLGLSTVRQIVRRLGGDVWFESPDAGGTVFRVALPDAMGLRSSEQEGRRA